MDEKPPIPGHESLTMAEQMRAQGKPARLQTSPVTGAVESPRREYIKRTIQAKADRAASQTGKTVAGSAALANTEW